MKNRSCRRQFPLYYPRAEAPASYGAELLRWLWLAVTFGVFTWFGASQLARAGGVFGTADERLARRIARHRRHIDDAIFLHLARVAPLYWRAACLELEWLARQGEARLRHSVADPQGPESAVQLPEGLYRATDELLDLFQKHGQTFRRTAYPLSPGPGGRWQRTLVVE